MTRRCRARSSTRAAGNSEVAHLALIAMMLQGTIREASSADQGQGAQPHEFRRLVEIEPGIGRAHSHLRNELDQTRAASVRGVKKSDEVDVVILNIDSDNSASPSGQAGREIRG